MSDTNGAPRRTFADVVANPPEGWRVGVVLDAGETVRFDHGDAAFVWFSLVTGSGSEGVYARTPAKRKAAAYRAVADLLDLLAEVSDV